MCDNCLELSLYGGDRYVPLDATEFALPVTLPGVQLPLVMMLVLVKLLFMWEGHIPQYCMVCG